uniref:Proteasome subunit beta type-3-like n=1 Tax=Dermatophagoides pteronyssinus TaxID=6956 RepID=A0A6P6Y9X8_DERPT|nr:proteasome subunit beta type-3-like [Dermatophagoides pteronyssinus]
MTNVFSYNGGCVCAMAGEECIAIASDKRLGANFYTTVNFSRQKCFAITPKVYFLCCGLQSHAELLYRQLRQEVNLLQITEEREIEPAQVASLLGNILYAKRFQPFYVSPIVAGLTACGKPYLCEFDLIGTPEVATEFSTAGSADLQISGACELFYRPGLSAEELFSVAANCLIAASERDCCSGWGGVVYVVSPDKVVERHIETRMD